MVRFVFAYMEPFAVIVGGTPGPCWINRHQPGVIPLPKFRKRAFPGLVQQTVIEVQVVTLDALSCRRTECHGDAEFLHDLRIELPPYYALKGIIMIKGIRSRKMIKQRPDRIGL